MHGKMFFAALFISFMLLFGCASQPSAKFPTPPPSPALGGDKDAHGCIGSAGYSWCEAKQKCYRPWEENCTSPQGGAPCKTASDCPPGAARCADGICTQYDEHGCVPDGGYQWCESLGQCVQPWATPCPSQPDGSDMDEHGCIGSAGYSWCPDKQQCIRPWETACTAADRIANAAEHCLDANVAQVSVCGQYIKTVSSLIGGGSTFYDDYGNEIACPLVSPESMSPQCSLLMMGSNCAEQIIDCAKAAVPAAVSDLRDDPGFAGAQLSWSAPDSKAVDYEIFRGDAGMKSVSLIKTTGQTGYNDVFEGKGATFAYFVRARNAEGAESPASNIIYVQQLSTASRPSPGQIG